MKKFLATNDKRTSVAVGINLSKCLALVAEDTEKDGHIFAYDTESHTCYTYKKVLNGYALMGEPVTFVDFDNRTQFYKLILSEVI